jgi:hypothetical protein
MLSDWSNNTHTYRIIPFGGTLVVVTMVNVMAVGDSYGTRDGIEKNGGRGNPMIPLWRNVGDGDDVIVTAVVVRVEIE